LQFLSHRYFIAISFTFSWSVDRGARRCRERGLLSAIRFAEWGCTAAWDAGSRRAV